MFYFILYRNILSVMYITTLVILPFDIISIIFAIFASVIWYIRVLVCLGVLLLSFIILILSLISVVIGTYIDYKLNITHTNTTEYQHI